MPTHQDVKMFKVVYVDAWGIMTSCAIRSGKSCIAYEQYKWTAKRKYGPMVFSDQFRATGFLKMNFPFVSPQSGYWEVWECDAQNVRECRFLLSADDVIDLNNETVRRRMDAVQTNGGSRDWNSQWAPTGTFLTSRIRLTRKVW